MKNLEEIYLKVQLRSMFKSRRLRGNADKEG